MDKNNTSMNIDTVLVNGVTLRDLKTLVKDTNNLYRFNLKNFTKELEDLFSCKLEVKKEIVFYNITSYTFYGEGFNISIDRTRVDNKTLLRYLQINFGGYATLSTSNNIKFFYSIVNSKFH